MTHPEQVHSRSVIAWLVCVCLLIVLMTAVGGITRLTGSGLSMVEWKPILGAVPPMSEVDWQDAFDKYQAYPQFQLQNQEMDLGEFKFIYFWEYVHRLLGRLIGIAFLLPMVFFAATGRIRGRVLGKLIVAFVLGGLQGLLGWYMVKSGLVDKPYVSHFRLAAHLSLALLLFAYLFWILLDLLPRRSIAGRTVPGSLRVLAPIYLVVLAIQIVYGAFVAGLKAGYFFNTFPTMQGFWVPPGLIVEGGVVHSFLHNPIAVQFAHRGFGWLLVLFAIALAAFVPRAHIEKRARHFLVVVPALTLTQFVLGALTLAHFVPLALAAMHQVTAALLLGAAVGLVHDLFTTPAGSVEDIPTRPRETGPIA